MCNNKTAILTGEPELMRKINQALILDLLRNKGELSRAQISRRTKLSKATVSRVVNELIKNKLITEIGEGDSKETGGRRPIMLTINSSDRFVVGVDLGTTNTVAAIANLKGEILKKIRVPTNKNHSLDTISSQVSNIVNDVIEEAEVKRKLIAGLGISVAGIVEKSTGTVKFSPNFNWENVNVAKLLEKKTGLRTIADNCTRVMAIGEIWHGKGNSFNIFYVNLGYGIGSALVIKGKVYDNHSEFGHISISNEKILCSCGKYGCLEAVASGNALERKANQLFKDINNKWITAKDIAERAKQGDPIAEKIFEEIGKYLGKGISFIASVFYPDKVIIGGGISLAGKILLNPIINSFNEYTMEQIKSNTEIELSSLGMDAGVYGAITMVLNQLVFYTSLLRRNTIAI